MFCLLQTTGSIGHILPKGSGDTFDLRLYFEDLSLGFSPSMWLEQTIGYGFLGRLLELSYESWAVAVGLSCGMAVLSCGKRRRDVILVFVWSCVVGLMCYRLVPACGPAYLRSHGFDLASYRTAEVPYFLPGLTDMPIEYDRNCMPSLHVTWALLVALLVKDIKGWRWVGVLFALLTGLAAMWNGEHYFVDLVAALPFAYALYYFICEYKPIRAALASFLFVWWLLTVRNNPYSFWKHPSLCWGAIVVGVLTLYMVPALSIAWTEHQGSYLNLKGKLKALF